MNNVILLDELDGSIDDQTVTLSQDLNNMKSTLNSILNSLPAVPGMVSWASPGTYTWTVPPKVTRVTIEIYGASGGGGGFYDNYNGDWGYVNGCGGGGGGYAKKNNIPVSPGQTITIVIGSGGSYGIMSRDVAPTVATAGGTTSVSILGSIPGGSGAGRITASQSYGRSSAGVGATVSIGGLDIATNGGTGQVQVGGTGGGGYNKGGDGNTNKNNPETGLQGSGYRGKNGKVLISWG